MKRAFVFILAVLMLTGVSVICTGCEETPEKENNNYFKMLKDVPNLVKGVNKKQIDIKKDSYIASFNLDYEYSSIQNELNDYVGKMNKACKGFFKKSHIFDNVINEIDSTFEDMGTKLKGKATAANIALLDEKMINIKMQSDIALENLRNKNDKKSLERVEIIKDLRHFLDEKIVNLNVKFGELAQLENNINIPDTQHVVISEEEINGGNNLVKENNEIIKEEVKEIELVENEIKSNNK